jgi:hypothetical protein
MSHATLPSLNSSAQMCIEVEQPAGQVHHKGLLGQTDSFSGCWV